MENPDKSSLVTEFTRLIQEHGGRSDEVQSFLREYPEVLQIIDAVLEREQPQLDTVN